MVSTRRLETEEKELRINRQKGQSYECKVGKETTEAR